MYGLWLNDPKTGGLGANTYVTAQQFLSTYFAPITVVGDTYKNYYLALTDPPEDIPVELSDAPLIVAASPSGFTPGESVFIHTQMTGSYALAMYTTQKYITAARTTVQDVLNCDSSELRELFSKTTLSEKPYFTGHTVVVTFTYEKISFAVTLQKA